MSKVHMNIDVDINFLFHFVRERKPGHFPSKILINIRKQNRYKDFGNSSVAKVDCELVFYIELLTSIFERKVKNNHDIQKIYLQRKVKCFINTFCIFLNR